LHRVFRSAWKDFTPQFQKILKNLATHKQLLDSHATAAQIHESHLIRAEMMQTSRQADAVERNNRRLTVLNWLSAADMDLYQESLRATRDEYPNTSQWVLHKPEMRKWLDPAVSSVPVLWVKGIPGGGIYSFVSQQQDYC
jgi:hypothetical protein